MSKRRILVTGGAGYIGSHTARMLARRGYHVTVVDDLSRGYRHNVESPDFHQLRVQQTDAMAEVLAGHDAAIHFAAFIAVGESMRLPEMYFENNVAGSLSLFTAMQRAGVKHLVFSSTAAVYGIPHASPILETFPIAPVNPYGESKVMVETLLRWFDTIHSLRSVCLRYFNACGADPAGGLGEEHDPETHLIPLMLRAVDYRATLHRLRPRLRYPRWHLHSRLYPCERLGRGACPGPRSPARRRLLRTSSMSAPAAAIRSSK